MNLELRLEVRISLRKRPIFWPRIQVRGQAMVHGDGDGDDDRW